MLLGTAPPMPDVARRKRIQTNKDVGDLGFGGRRTCPGGSDRGMGTLQILAAPTGLNLGTPGLGVLVAPL